MIPIIALLIITVAALMAAVAPLTGETDLQALRRREREDAERAVTRAERELWAVLPQLPHGEARIARRIAVLRESIDRAERARARGRRWAGETGPDRRELARLIAAQAEIARAREALDAAVARLARARVAEAAAA